MLTAIAMEETTVVAVVEATMIVASATGMEVKVGTTVVVVVTLLITSLLTSAPVMLLVAVFLATPTEGRSRLTAV